LFTIPAEVVECKLLILICRAMCVVLALVLRPGIKVLVLTSSPLVSSR